MVRFIAPWDISGYGAFIVCLLLLCGSLYRLTGCHSTWIWLSFLCLLFATGFLHASLRLEPPSVNDHISRFAETSPLILEGTIIAIEERESGGFRLLAEMHRVIKNRSAATASGKLLLYIKEGELAARPGQVVRWRARLRRPYNFGNPGEFDYPLYLAARDIYATSFIGHAEDLVVLVNHPEQQSKTLENLRISLAAYISQVVPEDAAGFLQSLLLGMRGGISKEQRQLIADSGVAHLFAISGLHFGLLALMLYQVGRWFYTRSQRLIFWHPPQRVIPVLLIVPLAVYLLLTGNAWATRRAFLMVTVGALLFAKGHRTPTLSLLATVALCVLCFNPLALFQPGFQLSFAGVAGILIWLPRWQQFISGFSKPIRWPLILVATTAAATLATIPATLWHFHKFAPAGLVTNLIAIPMIAWGAVPVGLVSMSLLSFSTVLADWGLLFSAKLVTIAIQMVSAINKWPGLEARPFHLTASTLILLIGFISILLPFKMKRHQWFYYVTIILLASGCSYLARPQIADFQVTALSVGQGDATLVSLADDIHYLVDGGGLPGSSIEPGEQLVAPALGRMGISRLQGVILTHNHPDHSSGLVYVLRHFQTEHFYFAGDVAGLSPELLEVLQQKGVTIHHIEEGWTHLQKHNNQSFSLYAPSQKPGDINERSIAVFAGDQNEGVLLTADLGVLGLQQLKRAGVPGRISLLKLPHHGSRHAQPWQYLDWAQPSAAFVSSGRGNSYGFPHQPTIEACLSRQTPLFRTDTEGLLTFHIDNGQWQVRTSRAL